jgi:diguanylate cyclase (GGDEF)-like protein
LSHDKFAEQSKTSSLLLITAYTRLDTGLTWRWTEFLIVLTACVPSDLIVTAERMRIYVSEKPVDTDTGPIPVTISIGLAAQPAAGCEPIKGEDLVRAADSALYVAKASGRNRVERAPENIAASPVLAGAQELGVRE